MRIHTVLTALAAAAALSLAAAPANAAADFFTAYVDSVLVNADNTYGGCMIHLTVDPKSRLAACGSGWISLDCEGKQTDAVRAYRMLDQAQLALVASRAVLVVIEDSPLINGYCYARRIDVY